MGERRKLKLGLNLQGIGSQISAWRHPDAVADASTNIAYYQRQIRLGEQAGFDFAFVADGLYINAQSVPHFLNRFEPVSLLASLAVVTERIGLVATVSTTYSQPVANARQLASIDLISNGRAGWNIVTSPLEGSALNFGKTVSGHPSHGERYRIAGAYLDEAAALWDSWGQGRPVLFQAGSSDSGRSLAARYADAALSEPIDLDAALEYYRDLKARASGYGRRAEELVVLADIKLIVADTDEAAQAKRQELASLLDAEKALQYLGRFFEHHDFSQYPLDGPFPELGSLGDNSFRGETTKIKRYAREHRLTLRETALWSAATKSDFIGSPASIADRMQAWLEAGAVDGFIISSAGYPGTLEDFATKVVPILQQRGLFRKSYEAGTLRGNLGLPGVSPKQQNVGPSF